MTITQTIVDRTADACPTSWCGLPTGHERAGHRTTVASLDGIVMSSFGTPT